MDGSQVFNPYLAGNFAPVRSEDDFEMKVVGRIPDALAGAYYRNGPNPQFDPPGRYVGYLGDGMIHAFFLEPNKDGGRARYRNRWVRTPKWHAEFQNTPTPLRAHGRQHPPGP